MLSWRSCCPKQGQVTAQWIQDSLIYATLKLPHPTNAKEAEIEAVFPDHFSRQVYRYVGFSQVKMKGSPDE